MIKFGVINIGLKFISSIFQSAWLLLGNVLLGVLHLAGSNLLLVELLASDISATYILMSGSVLSLPGRNSVAGVVHVGRLVDVILVVLNALSLHLLKVS